MEEQINWLKEHKFTYNEEKKEWTRTLDVIGNFKVEKADETGKPLAPVFQKRKIQSLCINVKYFDDESAQGWGVMLDAKNGFDLDEHKDFLYVTGKNRYAALCDTPQEAIGVAADDLCQLLISTLKQVAKLSTKELTLNFEDVAQK